MQGLLEAWPVQSLAAHAVAVAAGQGPAGLRGDISGQPLLLGVKRERQSRLGAVESTGESGMGRPPAIRLRLDPFTQTTRIRGIGKGRRRSPIQPPRHGGYYASRTAEQWTPVADLMGRLTAVLTGSFAQHRASTS